MDIIRLYKSSIPNRCGAPGKSRPSPFIPESSYSSTTDLRVGLWALYLKEKARNVGGGEVRDSIECERDSQRTVRPPEPIRRQAQTQLLSAHQVEGTKGNAGNWNTVTEVFCQRAGVLRGWKQSR